MKQAPLNPGRRIHRADQLVALARAESDQEEQKIRADRGLRRFSWEAPAETVRGTMTTEAADGRL